MAEISDAEYLRWAALIADPDTVIASSKKQTREQKALAKVHQRGQARYTEYLRLVDDLQRIAGSLSQQAAIYGAQVHPTEVDGQSGYLVIRNDPRLDALERHEPKCAEPIPPVHYDDLLNLVRRHVEDALDEWLEAHSEAWRRGVDKLDFQNG